DLEDDGGDILAAEEVLAILERLRGKPVFGPQSFSEGTKTGAISRTPSRTHRLQRRCIAQCTTGFLHYCHTNSTWMISLNVP
ncbi:MAG: hypothetical protein WB630_10655, partial [Candidatus Acidiferrales bacterium]